MRDKKYAEAAESLRLAFEISNENVKALEKLSEVHLLRTRRTKAVRALVRAVQEYGRTGLMADAERCRKRARTLDPAVVRSMKPSKTRRAPRRRPAPDLRSKMRSRALPHRRRPDCAPNSWPPAT